ncbi:hypothetical protein Trydic_g21105 [Trypoxylus dichotomus]
MVKVLFLSLLVAAMMCCLASTLPAPQLARSFRQELFASPTPSTSPVLEDPATRNERSTNLSFITGTARKIRLFIKNKHLQLLPDGTVNGTDDASSIYKRINNGFWKSQPITL